MRRTNAGSIGEMPPRTRVSRPRSARIARPAAIAMPAKRDQSGSISKSQCDALLSSFQIITASTMRKLLVANTEEDLVLRRGQDAQAGGAQHRLDAGAVRDPPVGRIAGVPLLDEVYERVAGRAENAGLLERVVVGHLGHHP